MKVREMLIISSRLFSVQKYRWTAGRRGRGIDEGIRGSLWTGQKSL